MAEGGSPGPPIYWIAHVDIAGPTSCYQDAKAYEPAQVWLRGWPASFRRTILLASVFFVILATAATLWRSRWAVVAVAAVCAVATGLGFFWRNREPVGIERSVSIVVRTGTTTQRDRWSYNAVLRGADGTFPCQSLTRPIFVSPTQADDLSVCQRFSADGHPPVFVYHLEPRQSLAFLTRTVMPRREKLSPTKPVNSALKAMADEIYAMHGDEIVGQVKVEGDESQWPEVVIDRGRVK